MSTVRLDLSDDVVTLLRESERPDADAAREIIVLALYRRGAIGSGRGAELLGMERFAVVRYASGLGIPFFDMTTGEWEAELARIEAL